MFSSAGDSRVHPCNSGSPSDNTLDTDVAIASVRIRYNRIRSLGSVDSIFERNSVKTDNVRYPSIKSNTACANQSEKVEEYMLDMGQ